MKIEKKYNCKIVTPFYSTGFDGETADIRVPEIKSMMRFWFRVLQPNLSADKMAEMESVLFGGIVEEKEKNSEKSDARKSRFSMRLVNSNIKSDVFPITPHHYYSKQNCPVCNKSFCAKGKAREMMSGKFELAIRADENEIDHIENILSIMSTLGGVGRRSRRGFGSIMIDELTDISVKALLDRVNKLSGGSYRMENGGIKINFGQYGKYNYVRDIFIGNKYYKTPKEILSKISMASHNWDCYYTGLARGETRLASPIVVSVIEREGRYYPVITKLNTVFPDGLINDKNEITRDKNKEKDKYCTFKNEIQDIENRMGEIKRDNTKHEEKEKLNKEIRIKIHEMKSLNMSNEFIDEILKGGN